MGAAPTQNPSIPAIADDSIRIFDLGFFVRALSPFETV